MRAKPAGVILAGGRSSRMGGIAKALIPLGKEPLLSHVIQRLQAQVGTLFLSCESQDSDLATFGLPVVPDILPRHRGPLTGLCSTLHYMVENEAGDSLVLCPCDAPFIPINLVECLLDAAAGEEKPVVLISYEGVLQPTFSLWHSHHLPLIHEAVLKRGEGGLKHMLHSLPQKVVEWVPTEPSPFYNVNTPEDLKAATVWIEQPG